MKQTRTKFLLSNLILNFPCVTFLTHKRVKKNCQLYLCSSPLHIVVGFLFSVCPITSQDSSPQIWFALTKLCFIQFQELFGKQIHCLFFEHPQCKFVNIHRSMIYSVLRLHIQLVDIPSPTYCCHQGARSH